MVKYIVLDIDGTIIDHTYELNSETRSTIITIQEQGYIVILSSGRGYRRIERYANELMLKENNGFVFESNGSAIINMETMERTRIGSIDQLGMSKIIQLTEGYNVEIHFYVSEGLYYYLSPNVYKQKERLSKLLKIDQSMPWVGGVHEDFRDMRDTYPFQKMIQGSDDLPKEIIKVSIFVRGSSTDEIFSKLSRRTDNFEIVRTSPNLIEVTQENVNKGNCLRMFMETYNIKSNEIIAFGDGENDVSMFEQTDISFAMGSAQEYVKSKALYVTDTASNNGVIKGLKKVGIIK